MKLSSVASALGVDVSTLTLHNVQTPAGAATANYVVSSGSDNYSVSVEDSSGTVTLNTTDIGYTDTANGVTTGSMTGKYVKVGADALGAAVGYVTVQGQNFKADAGALVNSRMLLVVRMLLLQLAILLIKRMLTFTLEPLLQIHWLCWTKLSHLLINSVLLWGRCRTV